MLADEVQLHFLLLFQLTLTPSPPPLSAPPSLQALLRDEGQVLPAAGGMWSPHVLLPVHHCTSHSKRSRGADVVFPVNLQNLKKTVDERQVLLTQAKVQYKTALKNLEKISDEIHQRRRSSVFGPRGCGVGSEDEGVQGAELQHNSSNKLEEEDEDEEEDAISSKTTPPLAPP